MSDDRAKHCFEAIQEIFEGIQFFFFYISSLLTLWFMHYNYRYSIFLFKKTEYETGHRQ
jgi:hypothetical protein